MNLGQNRIIAEVLEIIDGAARFIDKTKPSTHQVSFKGEATREDMAIVAMELVNEYGYDIVQYRIDDEQGMLVFILYRNQKISEIEHLDGYECYSF